MSEQLAGEERWKNTCDGTRAAEEMAVSVQDAAGRRVCVCV